MGRLLMADSETTSVWKLVGINVAIFFVVANVLYWAIPTVTSISDLFRRIATPVIRTSADDWSRTHRRETQASKLFYKSFVGWRGQPFAGDTVNVEGPYGQRRTVNGQLSSKKRVYFFGGSTMWGAGSDDSGTIPSQFSAIAGIHSENFGERGWTAHQSLMLLIQLIQEGHRPEVVVFYDGVNDVYFKCNRLHNADSHGWENPIAGLINEPLKSSTFTHYFAPVKALAVRIQRALKRASSDDDDQNNNVADCHQNSTKAKAIAENLLRDWQLAKQLVTAYGGEFIGVLQPLMFYSHTRANQSALSPVYQHLKLQYDAVYPLLTKRLVSDREYHDLTSVLDHDEDLYLDFCHIGPNGNRYVANKIAEIVSSPKSR
jgi:hypothetical protein